MPKTWTRPWIDLSINLKVANPLMKISIRIDSAAAQAQLRRWGGEYRDKVKKAVARAIRSEATEIKQEVREQVASQMAVVKNAFLKGFNAKVLDQDPNRLPALYVGSRIPWSGIHERGPVQTRRQMWQQHGQFPCGGDSGCCVGTAPVAADRDLVNSCRESESKTSPRSSARALSAAISRSTSSAS